MADKMKTLYERLGGHDAIATVAKDLLPRLQSDRLLDVACSQLHGIPR